MKFVNAITKYIDTMYILKLLLFYPYLLHNIPGQTVQIYHIHLRIRNNDFFNIKLKWVILFLPRIS